tara:strand:+ start:76 stop:930 length:855 start_codon:yes stop_codon:yes gene_type:complete
MYIGKTPTVGNFQVCDAISVVNGQAAYTLQVGGVNVAPESANHMLVSLNGILQKPGSSFTISSSTMTFASNLATGDVIDFVQILGNVLDIGQPSDDTVTAAKINNDVISGQTALTAIPATTDEFLISDAGTIKRIDAQFFQSTPAFAATAAGNAISADTYTKAQNGTELLDTDGCYDSSSNYRFTPDVAGKYFLSNRISVNPDSNMQYIRAAIYKNGSSIAEMQKIFDNSDPIGNSHFSMELNMISEANGSSDYFEAYAYLQQNGDYINTSGGNLFLGYKIIGA